MKKSTEIRCPKSSIREDLELVFVFYIRKIACEKVDCSLDRGGTKRGITNFAWIFHQLSGKWSLTRVAQTCQIRSVEDRPQNTRWFLDRRLALLCWIEKKKLRRRLTILWYWPQSGTHFEVILFRRPLEATVNTRTTSHRRFQHRTTSILEEWYLLKKRKKW